MATKAHMQLEPASGEREQVRWNTGVRIGFRFCFLYFMLYILTNQVFNGLIPTNGFEVPDLSATPAVRQMVFWTADHLFHVPQAKIVYQGSGSGDKTWDWVLAFLVLVFSVFGTAIWSALDRKRLNYVALHKWCYVLIRFALGTQMLSYGMDKFIPLQMPFPPLTRLVEPYGNFSPMGVLWYSIGASPAYEIFVGAAEMFGGILLFFPRTALFGALVCLADVIEVFTLNMTYDVPVKLFSFHLILMSLLLLGPEMRRIAAFFFSNRAVAPSSRPALFQSARRNRVAFWVQSVYGVVMIAANAYSVQQGWYKYGAGSPKSPLYGIWNVQGQPGEWKRVIFDRPQAASFQKQDDTFTGFPVTIDQKAGTIAVAKGNDKNFGILKYQRVRPDAMKLDGSMEGKPVHLELKLVDRSKMMLVSRGFHWVQEYPFNR